jgi:hypothetical protein
LPLSPLPSFIDVQVNLMTRKTVLPQEGFYAILPRLQILLQQQARVCSLFSPFIKYFIYLDQKGISSSSTVGGVSKPFADVPPSP